MWLCGNALGLPHRLINFTNRYIPGLCFWWWTLFCFCLFVLLSCECLCAYVSYAFSLALPFSFPFTKVASGLEMGYHVYFLPQHWDPICLEIPIHFFAFGTGKPPGKLQEQFFQILIGISTSIAAFHNEGYHPHAHLIAYSTVESEGYLTKQGVQKLRSSFAKDIFSQDLLCIYPRQREPLSKPSRSASSRRREIITVHTLPP